MEHNEAVTAASHSTARSAALKFIVLVGVVSLFADMTYEGARSITGPFLAVLGASGTVVGIVAGSGELVGYALRLVSGYISDRTRQYWTITIIGYCINLLAVPLLALAGNWGVAAVLMILERTGKAIRAPSRDVLLSHATKQVGRGFGFGLHEALDQIGAVTGPLIVSLVLYLNGGYKTGFAILLVPALMALLVLAAARLLYPQPQQFEETAFRKVESKGLPRVFWVYLAGISLIAAGYADFPLVAFHFEKESIVSANWIPVFYAIAMGVDGVAALAFGRLFDRMGVSSLAIAALFSAFFAPLVFLGNFGVALLGAVVWGIGMGAQESIMRAAVAEMVSSERRGSAYGIFNAGYGVSWFLGSVLLGVLYDISLPALIAFSMAAQFAAVPVILRVRKSVAAR
ncbi:MAG: MFS transporter [Chloroflexi bacterium]|nr:MFS transporter [Chloroflexota bacterium]